MIYKFIKKYQYEHSIEKMAKVFGVSRSGYYSWNKRPESKMSKRSKILKYEIDEIFRKSKGTYGYKRIYQALKIKGIECGINRVAKIMHLNGLKAKAAKKYKATTDSQHNNPVAENILNRQFKVEKQDKVWVSDITYIHTKEGWLYLCVIIDLYSRKVVGFHTSNRITKELVIKSLMLAVIQRRPKKGLIFHSDRGVQYTSKDFQVLLKKEGMICSMSRKGNCWDNACSESFFHTLKMEEVNSKTYQTRKEAHLSIFEYIEVFYNRKRLHSSIGYSSPVDFEEKRIA